MEVPEDKATSRAEFDKKDAISKILDSLVTLVDQHLREHRIREGTWFWSTSFQTTKNTKRCSIIGSLHWQTTRLRTYLVPSPKRRLVKAQKKKKKKKKKKSKDIFKGIASSNRSLVGAPCPTVMTGDVGTGDLPLAS